MLLIFTLCCGNSLQAQVLSEIPNRYFTPDPRHEAFEMPTVTDVVQIGNTTLQAIIATTPEAILYWDDYAGHDGQTNIKNDFASDINPSDIILLDDAAWASNGAKEVLYISCRIINTSNGTTDFCILPYRWFRPLSIFISGTLIRHVTNIIPANNFDRMSIAVAREFTTNENAQPFALAYNNNGTILYNQAMIDYGTGVLTFLQGDKIMFEAGSGDYPGKFRNPDICSQSANHGAVCALYQEAGGIEKVVVKFSDEVYYKPWDAYSGSGKLRTARIDMFNKYDCVIAVNRYNGEQSEVFVIGKYTGIAEPNTEDYPLEVFTAPVVINQDLENLCGSNRSNSKYTGFPDIKVTERDPEHNQYYIFFDVVWQQVFCGESNCNINAVSRRYKFRSDNTISLRNSEYFHINFASNRNSVFPSMASLPAALCKTFYSFGVMDRGRSDNGQVAYKQAICNGPVLRPAAVAASTVAKNEQVITAIYPNPANSIMYVELAASIKQADIYLFNSTGNIICKQSVTNKRKTGINVDNYAMGTYLVKVVSGNEVTVKKIVILR
jgi:hypothetical protein